jgi:hypothetical protein
MDQHIREVMERGGIADITTVGRRSGLPHRLEIYFHHFDGAFYLTGRPGRRRHWQANIEANPHFVLHLKRGITADVPVVGETEPDPEVRRAVMRRAMTESWGADPDEAESRLDDWVARSPFIRFRPR